MRRVDQHSVARDLPELDPEQLSEDRRLYLQHMLGMIETGDMFHGRFVEVHVGWLLDADIADSGVNGWDLLIPGRHPIDVEVKAAATGRSYRITRKRVDVWVFVTFDDKRDGPEHFRYAVAPAEALGGFSGRMSQKKVFETFGVTSAKKLRAAVIAAARRRT